MKLPAWPSHVAKNDDFVYIGFGPKHGFGLKGVLTAALYENEKTLIGEKPCRAYSGDGELHYFVKKGEPFLARFAPQMPADLPPLPEGTVYIGKGGTECHPSWSFSALKICYFDLYYYNYRGVWTKHNGWSSSDHIAATIDSPLHKAQPWYVPNTEVKPVVNVENKPNITPLPAHIKVPEGYVYCGKGNEVKVPSGFDTNNCTCRFCLYEGGMSHDTWFGQSSGLFYFFPIGSEIAIFNGHTVKKRRETLKEKDSRIEALNKEIAALKEQVAKYQEWIKSAPKV